MSCVLAYTMSAHNNGGARSGAARRVPYRVNVRTGDGFYIFTGEDGFLYLATPSSAS
jgi:hypothetical protein